MPASDAKLVLRDAATATRLRAAIAAGRTPPLSAVFQDSEVRRLDDAQKRGHTFVQMSFLMTNPAHDVLPVVRAAHDEAKSPSGHTLLQGASLLVSWSPIENRNRTHHPREIADIEFFYRKEVEDQPETGRPTFQFLGLIENHVAAKAATYLFYLWEVIYDAQRGQCPVLAQFQKDRYDRPDVLQPLTCGLLEAMQDRRAELQAVNALAARYKLPLDWPPGLDLAGSRLVAAAPTDPGRMGDLIDEPLPHVFLSKTKSDAVFVALLRSALHSRHIRTWVDEDQLHTGTHWYAQAETAIHYAPIFVCISQTAKVTDGMQREISQALDLHWQRRSSGLDLDLPWIVPVVVGDADWPKREQVPPALRGFPPLPAPRTPAGFRNDDIEKIADIIKDHLLRQGYL